ncbi:MAG: ABC transporter ATP-binding protein [Eggerthellaceae bacterium]|nr:ABC transporter ATP-binding protein [Eggerthellaceae bacterium]
MSFLALEHVSKTYQGMADPVVDDLSLDVEKGEIVVLLGSSGCGKTTLLKTIAGLETQDAGTVSIDGECVDGINAEKRPIAMVFQKALLFRNMTVEQNINFAPRVNRTMEKAEMAAKVEEMLELIEMKGMGKKKATELSGGQEQRVSLARALMTNPKILLLDEPFSALDAQLRVTMRQHIKRINQALGTTMVFVTHDQQEAVEVADRIALMHGGRILQYAKPIDFYERPNSRAVADFFGWRNFVPAQKNGACIECALGTFDFEGCEAADGSVDLAIRPEAVICANDMSNAASTDLPYEGTLLDVMPQGPFTLCRVSCKGVELELLVKATEAPTLGDTFCFGLNKRMMWPVA